MKITKTWKTSGKTVTVTGELITSKINYCDGDNVTVPCCDMRIDVDFDGHGSQGDWVRELTVPIEKYGMTYVASVGKLALTQEQVAIIKSVKSEIEATPEWQAKIARVKTSEKAEEEYQKHYNRVKDMMEE